MGKMTFEVDHKMTDELPPLYARVAAEAGVEDEVAREVLRALRRIGYTIATPRVQWR